PQRTPALEGAFAVTLVGDAQSATQVPSRAGVLRTVLVRDGFSVVPQQWVALMRLPDRADDPRPGDSGGPFNALQHYRVPPPSEAGHEGQAQAGLDEAVAHARKALGAPLAQLRALPAPDKLYAALTTGLHATYSATAVPVAGDKVVLSSRWRAIAHQGVMLL